MVRLCYEETDEFIIFNKPIGLNTHAVDSGKDGLVEFLSEKLKQKLYPVSRLDQATSGIILFANASSVQKISQLEANKEIIKEYLLLTDRPFNLSRVHELDKCHFSLLKNHSEEKPHFLFKTEITQKDKIYKSHLNSHTNAESEFSFVRKMGETYLWSVRLHTGKTHQIRLHCQNLQMPILGDSLYQGTSFYRICLHSVKLTFFGKSYESDLPLWADEFASQFLNLKREHQITLEAIEKRRLNYQVDSNDCFRWLHQEIPVLKLDQFGEYLYLYDYSSEASFSGEVIELISKFFKKSVFIRQMKNRGDDPNENNLWIFRLQEQKREKVIEPITWIAYENGSKYELRTHQGLSPGLFLDQRENRRWVFENSKGKNILNLFSYTGGFSLMAAVGGASGIDTVDVSQKFIQWSQKNFEINDLVTSDSEKKFRFWVQDCLVFLKIAVKKRKKWDLIVLDPPTFGRSKFGVFQIEKNFDELLTNVSLLVSEGGKILLSTNFEKWNYFDLISNVKKNLKGYNYEIFKAPSQSLDFDYPHQNSLMKSMIIHIN